MLKIPPEKGVLKKDWGGKISVALVFPNRYEVGMANLGFQGIYALFNSFPDIVCERFFMDFEGSIESGRPPGDFDVIAFSLPFELDWLNVIKFLKNSKIPPLKEERDKRHPLVIAGGISVSANPIPLSPFIDLFVIGEGESVIPRIVDALREAPDDREKLLEILEGEEGIWTPGRKGKRAWTKNLGDFPFHTFVFTPNTELRDMFLIEAERGCFWRCKFCLVGHISRPPRTLPKDTVIELAKRGLELTKSIGIVGSSPGEHPEMGEITEELLRMGARISLSSLRLNTLKSRILTNIKRSGTRSVTLAIEAGTERLRNFIEKRLTDEDIERGALKIKNSGIREVKLYFMFGIPTETEEDLREIPRILENFRGLRVSLNFSPFVPKAHTPFERLPMEREESLEEKMKLIRSLLKGYEIKFESPDLSIFQGVLSRGDENIGRGLIDIERVREWKKKLPDWERYIYREIPPREELPWNKIDVGI